MGSVTGILYMFHRIVFVPESESGPCGEDCSYHLLKELNQWVKQDESVPRQLSAAWGSLFCPVTGFQCWAKSFKPYLSKFDANDFGFVSWIFEQKFTILFWKIESLLAGIKSDGTLFQKI